MANRYLRWTVGVLVWFAAVSASQVSGLRAAAPQQQPAAAAPQQSAASSRALVDKYCVTCHNERLKTGGLMLDKADLTNIPAGAETWEKVARKLRAGMMPPIGMPRPDGATLQSFATQLENTIDAAADPAARPGRVGAHRLNRFEYGNAVRDLLRVNVDVGVLLPPDSLSYGFDNIAESLVVAPALLEKYMTAAAKISRLAVGDPDGQLADLAIKARPDLSQDKHLDGLPLGTRGGVVAEVNFPLDGEYVFKPHLWRTQTEILRGMDIPSEVEILIDGVRVHTGHVGGIEDDNNVFVTTAEANVEREIDSRLEARVAVKAGPHTVGVTFVSSSVSPRVTLYEPFLKEKHDNQNPASGPPEIKDVMITGPFNLTGPGDTPSRRAIFVCRPTNEADAAPCAKRIVTQLARRAFRGPVSPRQINTLMTFYEKGRAGGHSFDAGVQAALAYLLATPDFLFRFEVDPPTVAAGAPYRLNDVALASRLSFFLWSSIPDDELLTLATQGRLSRPAVLEQQVKRMLADPKAVAFEKNFLGLWLNLRAIQAFVPSPVEFTDFDANLREAMLRETELFFKSIVDEDRNVLDFLTADYTFVNERLARHYGMKNVYGEHFRRVSLTDDRRRGLLGQGSVLTITSFSTRTSPVVRGKFVLSTLMGIPPPPPPPNVPGLPDKPVGAALSMRQRMEAHRANPVCATCHKVMDPIGLSLEHFDGIGRWRDDDGGAAIDSTGQLADGRPINGVADLRAALAGSDLFVRNLTQNLLTYALGRGLDYRDMPLVRGIVKDAARNNYRFSSVIMGIVTSAPFTMSTKDVDAHPDQVASNSPGQR